MSAELPEREALTGEVLPPAAAPEPQIAGKLTIRVKRRRCGECYRLITTPGDHADGCSHIPGPVS